jgi:hypothetical protein
MIQAGAPGVLFITLAFVDDDDDEDVDDDEDDDEVAVSCSAVANDCNEVV